MKPSDRFSLAIADYLYLLERNYPDKSMLKMVGDRYALPAHERVMLYRGLATAEQIKARGAKQVTRFDAGSFVAVDGFNVCRTVGSYLSGNFVFEGLDGFLRDVSEIHRKKLNWDILTRSLRLILGYLKSHHAGKVHFYFDKPISHSGKMVAHCQLLMEEMEIAGVAETVFSPDHCLREMDEGVICTADSYVIDTAKRPAFDLAKQVLETNFQPKIFRIKEWIVL